MFKICLSKKKMRSINETAILWPSENMFAVFNQGSDD